MATDALDSLRIELLTMFEPTFGPGVPPIETGAVDPTTGEPAGAALEFGQLGHDVADDTRDRYCRVPPARRGGAKSGGAESGPAGPPGGDSGECQPVGAAPLAR
jgi:hypothetical protein